MDDNKVTVLLEDLLAQFHAFGEGLQLFNDKVEQISRKTLGTSKNYRENDGISVENREEH